MAVERVDDPTTSMYQPQIRQSDHVRFQRRSDRQTGPSEPLWSQGPMGPPFFRKKDQKIEQLWTPWSQRTMSLPFLIQKYPIWNPMIPRAQLFSYKGSKYRPNLEPIVPRAHLSSDLSLQQIQQLLVTRANGPTLISLMTWRRAYRFWKIPPCTKQKSPLHFYWSDYKTFNILTETNEDCSHSHFEL